jgi:hypothetical protein
MEDALAAAVTQHLHRIMQASDSHDTRSRELLRLAGNYRLEVLRPLVLAQFGDKVTNGLFSGMRLLPRAAEGCVLPKLFGSYEAALQPHLRAFAEARPEVVLNIGCAEGWYAVGMARLLPTAVVHAFDISPAAQVLCAEMAALNGVADRVRIGGAFECSDFAAFAGRKTLVLCDIEGAEQALLDPAVAPALRGFDLIVETHDGRGPVSAALAARFAETHHVTVLDGLQHTIDLPPWFATLPEIDWLLSAWEMRRSATPWLVMRPRGVEPHAAR